MPRACTICTHPSRAEIDAALSTGKNYRDLAERYGTSSTTLFRHRASHLGPEREAAAEIRRREIAALPPPQAVPSMALSSMATVLDVSQQLKLVNAVTIRVMTDARTEGDGRLVINAVNVILRMLEFQVRLSEQAQAQAQGGPAGLLASPEWTVLRGQIVAALRGYPDAAARVAELLDREPA